MARRVSWTNNSSGHTGTYVYRAPTLDPLNLPAPVATVAPVAQGATAEWNDSEALAAGDYDYAVQDFDGQGVGALSAVTTFNVPADLSTAQIGDYIEGGVYGGTGSNGVDSWHVIFGLQSSEQSTQTSWGNSGTVTGANDVNDGLANQTIILTNFDNADSFAFYRCRDYTDAKGNSDYYLPAINELALADALVDAAHPEFSQYLFRERWSSTETSDAGANARDIDAGITKNYSKSGENAIVRPVRRVPV